jgi:hypothetical protein
MKTLASCLEYNFILRFKNGLIIESSMTDICRLSEEYVILDPLYCSYTSSEWLAILNHNSIFRICPRRLSFNIRNGVPQSIRGEV